MANLYVIQSVSSIGDSLTVTGTVNGVPVTVNTWVSAAGNSLASAVGFFNFITPLMLAAVPSTPTAYPTLVGTVTK